MNDFNDIKEYKDIKYINGIETVKKGMANGLAIQIEHDDSGEIIPLTEEQRQSIIDNAAKAFGEFLDALGCDWRNDPNSNNTPQRVAKAYVNDLWEGRFSAPPVVTTFPSDGYDGMVYEGNIPITSMCSHHHQTILGKAYVAYVPNSQGRVVGLSKINRIVEYFSRRGAIQEQLTKGIHDALIKILDKPQGVAVYIKATHNCVACRGVKHHGADMQTAKLSGFFKEDPKARAEFYNFVTNSNSNN